jgi:hypothetical protein
MKPINPIPSSSSPFTLLLPTSTYFTHTYLFLHCTYFIVLSFIIGSKVSILYPSCEYALLWSVQLPLLLSLTPFLLPPIIRQLAVHTIMSSTCMNVKYFNTVDFHSLFLSLLPQVP